MSGTGHLDINPADRARLLASATAYAAGRRTYVVGAVSDVVAANAGRLDAAVRETLADAIRPAADAETPSTRPPGPARWPRWRRPRPMTWMGSTETQSTCASYCTAHSGTTWAAAPACGRDCSKTQRCLTGNGAPSPRVTCTRPDTRPKTHPSRPSSTWSHWGRRRPRVG